MTWQYDANYNYETNESWGEPWIFDLETGWFQDPLRDYTDRFFYFSPDGSTSEAAGHSGFTAASNLPQDLNSNGWTYDSFWRPDGTGDNVTLTLNENTSVFTGLPNHPYTGAAALTQTLDREFEGAYWEGSWYDDQFTLDIRSSHTNLRSLYYWGESGNDTFTIKGDFAVLDGNHDGSNESPSEVGQEFNGGTGYDRLIIEANSYDDFTIDYREQQRSHSSDVLGEIETIYEIWGPGISNFQARDVEEIVFNDQTFTSLTTPPSVTEGEIILSYNLTDEDIFNNLDQPWLNASKKQIAVLGDSVDHNARYDLNITADVLNNFMMEGADITIGFDAQLFNNINASDITIGSKFPIANAVEINNDLGTIRLAAATLSELALNGDDISGDTVLASISLDFDEVALAGIQKNADGSLATNPLAFTIDANLDETVFSTQLEDGTDFENRTIQTLRDLGGTITVDGQEVTLYEAQINLEQQGDGLVLGTQRVIGSDSAYTNLIRSGDTLSTSATWLNVGNIRANNIEVQSLSNANATLASASISQTALNSGSFIDGVFVEDGREDLTLTADIHITGQAGNVLDLADGILSVQADGSETFTNQGKGSSNLITFQGDLNYDGRVSMKDLAYLNAGAARQQLVESTDENGNTVQVASEASYARDVDADFSGKIDLADLSVLDADWGKTLHTGDQDFQGSADVSWSELDSQGDSSTWENDSFKDQNAIEAESDYVGSLEAPGTSGVIGSDGNQDGNNSLEGDNFQDPLAA